MTYWPGTKTHKSTGNAFDWQAKAGPSLVARDKDWQHSLASKKGTANRVHTNITYSKKGKK